MRQATDLPVIEADNNLQPVTTTGTLQSLDSDTNLEHAYNHQVGSAETRSNAASDLSALQHQVTEKNDKTHNQSHGTVAAGVDLAEENGPPEENGSLAGSVKIDGREKDLEEEDFFPHRIMYKIEYMDQDGDVFATREDNRRLNIEPPKKTALVVITSVTSHVYRYGPDFNRADAHPVHSIDRLRLVINSVAILKALQDIVDYYPGFSLARDSLTINEPFIVLLQHHDALLAYREKVKDKMEARCVRSEHAYEHLGLLLDFLEPKLKVLDAEKERHSRPTPVATYDMLWMLLKPGTDVYYDYYEDGHLAGFVVQRCERDDDDKNYIVKLWKIDYDGDVLGRRSYSVVLSPFEGEKEVHSLKIIPCHLYKQTPVTMQPGDQPTPQLQDQLIQDGRMFFRLTKHQCMDYSGETVTFPKRKYHSRVIIDAEQYYLDNDDTVKPNLNCLPNDSVTELKRCRCSHCIEAIGTTSGPKVSKFAEYDSINPLLVPELTDHQYFLCNRRIFGWLLSTRDWQLLDVRCVREPVWQPEIMQNLVIPEHTKNLIKGLSSRYLQDNEKEGAEQKSWNADFVQDKGDGQIFLLHGKPGVGKTFTAECVAQFTGRPLVSLTCGDIGVEAYETENRLTHMFKKAKRWGAVLLLDEADIYLEQRSTQDLKRNSLVAVFLRAMEYYSGILFLTTNRVGAFDDAFISRIHVVLYYRDFDEEQRKQVWRNFFAKLEKDRNGYIRVPIATKEYAEDSKDIKELKWNGREIRNAFQTAVSLAEYEGKKDADGKVLLKEDHLRQVAKMSSNFKSYLDGVHVGDEAQRAKRRLERLDHLGEV